MKKFAKSSMTLFCSVLLAACMTVSVSADAVTEVPAAATEEVVDGSQLILSRYLLCTASKNILYITANVSGTDVMGEIGLIDFVIERSSSGTGGWITTTYEVPNQIDKNTDMSSMAQYPVYVAGGYYYRVTVTFYAKDKGWFFPSKQEETVTSNVVWVPAG